MACKLRMRWIKASRLQRPRNGITFGNSWSRKDSLSTLTAWGVGVSWDISYTHAWNTREECWQLPRLPLYDLLEDPLARNSCVQQSIFISHTHPSSCLLGKGATIPSSNRVDCYAVISFSGYLVTLKSLQESEHDSSRHRATCKRHVQKKCLKF